ncbi:response regulator [Rhizobium tubonense]|uniref:response regulator n=1 Tax=Rhizobium tubonense TaxID=484088 RepID=UPI0018A87E73|nr:response regulator [Rhizobium tubonense]
MTARGELLEIACRRIADLDRPAYIKNSDLRYVAVNDAYARFFGREISDFIGRRGGELFEPTEGQDREDKERRAIVFGSEELATCFDPHRSQQYRLLIESFMPSEDRSYVFGMFQEAPAELVRTAYEGADAGADIARIRERLENSPHPVGIFADDGRALIANAAYRAGNDTPAVAAETAISSAENGAAVHSIVAESALDLMDVGVCIYNERDELIYQNAPWREFYRPVLGEVPLGVTLRWICERVFDHWQLTYPEQIVAAKIDRETWIARRLEASTKPHQDSVERLLSGRWLRSINKRMANGQLIGLRIDVTEMKEQELLLRKHVDEIGLYRTILEDLPVAAFVRDDNHRLVYLNEAYTGLTGLTRAEALGKTEYEMFETGASEFHAENEQVLLEGRALEFEGEVVDPLKVARPIMTRSNRVITSDGKRYIVGSMTDVSVLKLRQTQLIEAQAEAEALHEDLESILRSMPTGVMILDANYDVEYANDALYEIWDFPREDRLEGKPLRELVARHKEAGRYGDDPRDAETIYQSRIEVFGAAGTHDQTELKFEEGKVVILDSRRISGDRLLLAYSDISSVRRQEREITAAQNALEQLGELMRDATHAMSQGLLIVEAGIIMLTNDVLPDMLRVPPDYLQAGEHWARAFEHCAARGDFGDEPEALRLAWGESIQSRKPISTVFRVANERWIQLEATISAGDRWMLVLTDVTEMKEREAELQRLLARSEAADKAKSEFLANMSHEIRTPMNGVLGMAELLAKTKLDARQKTFIDIIVKSGNALLTIINDILDFSKIDAGQMSLRKVAFDPVEAIEDVATLLSSHASEKDIELLVRVSPAMPAMVLGDAGRFRQVVTNLVGNAVKFTERGHVLVDVDCRTIDGGGPMISVRVEDTGMGIPDEKVDSIFEKFSQVDGSSTRRHEGTGLGLAITAGLVDLFGGYLEVESEWGKGSAFTVHLPLPPAAARHDPKHVPVNVKGAHIVVIDDNEINRRILTEQLAMWGFDGVAAEDGKTGIAILEAAFEMQLRVDAVILDYHMPEMNGADVARLIRSDSRFGDLPLIFLTSMDVAGNDKEFAELSGQAHLMKPARANVLRNTIVEVVRTARQPEGSAKQKPAAAPAPSPPVSDARAELKMAIEVAERALQRQANAIEILVAEDNEVNQIVFTQILQSMDVRFLVVKNGEEAVKAWDELRPALIMMDVSMPVMNGLQATRAIRRIEAEEGMGSHVPIVGVTAHALESDREMCLASGMDDYMSKPISPELLEAKAERWLGNSGEEAARSSS